MISGLKILGLNQMEEVEGEVVIVGAGIAGLSTALGLHRQGIGSLVLESSDGLRNTGFTMITWTNAWRALDALGISHPLRATHFKLQGRVSISAATGKTISETPLAERGKHGDHEVRCLRRDALMEMLAKELPVGTIRYSSKVVSIEESNERQVKLLRLSDDSVIRAKVVIGSDGVNSIVANWLGFKKSEFTGRQAIRGYAEYEHKHGFEPKFIRVIGEGVHIGYIPMNEKIIYWFFTWVPTAAELQMDKNPAEMKRFMLSKLENAKADLREVIVRTELDCVLSLPLRNRKPWEVLFGNIARDNVCVSGDAFHPMTPDLGQGGCIAMEDGVVLARCLGEAILSAKSKDESVRIREGLRKYAGERRWRAFEVVISTYLVGFMQQNNGKLINFLRGRLLAGFLRSLPEKTADFDCGKLPVNSAAHSHAKND